MAKLTLTPRAHQSAGRAAADGPQRAIRSQHCPEPESGPERVRWQRWAACRDVPTADFFPVGNSYLARMEEERAKLMCSACPVRARCLAFAIEHEEGFGVWGGLNENERLALALAEKKGLNVGAGTADRTIRERTGS